MKDRVSNGRMCCKEPLMLRSGRLQSRQVAGRALGAGLPAPGLAAVVDTASTRAAIQANSGATPFPAQPFRPSMPGVWHAAHQRVSHIGGLHLCVPSPPRHDALATAHHPRALACVLRLQPRCAQSAPLASPHLPPPLAQVMILGSLTTFSLAFSTPVPRLPSSSTQGLRFDRARVLLLSCGVGLGEAWPRGLRGSLFVVLV